MEGSPWNTSKRTLATREEVAAANEVRQRRQGLLDLFSRPDILTGGGGVAVAAPPAGSQRTNLLRGNAANEQGGGRGGGHEANAYRPAALGGALSHGGTTATTAAFMLHGAAAFTKSGRPVILSANSRRLPQIFVEQQRNTRLVETAMGNVSVTLQKLTYDLSRVTDTQLPSETVAAVEENHRVFTEALAKRAGRDEEPSLSSGEMAEKKLFIPYKLRGKKGMSDYLMKLQRARTAAADESVDDSQSVVDYAGEAEVPRLAKDRTLQDELEMMRVSLTKIEECAGAMRADLSGNPDDRYVPGSTSAANANAEVNGGGVGVGDSAGADGRAVSVYGGRSRRGDPPSSSGGRNGNAATTYSEAGASSIPWWASALRTRDLKAHAIRLNYHARHAVRWNWRCREHVLLQTAFLNHHETRCRDDLVRLQGQLAVFAQRFRESEEAMANMHEDIAKLQQDLVEAANQRSALQEDIVALARSRGLISESESEPLSAELALLLSSHSWPAELREDVARVLQWMRAEQVSLE